MSAPKLISPKNLNVKYEDDGEIEAEHIEKVITNIISSNSIDNRVIFVFGSGDQTSAVYNELGKTPGIKVIYKRSLLPKCLFFLNPFIASYAGLIKIENKILLGEVFSILSDSSIACLYVFSKKHEKDFISSVKNDASPEYLDYGIKSDPGYILYIVDGDSDYSTTGIYGALSYGTGSDLNCDFKGEKMI